MGTSLGTLQAGVGSLLQLLPGYDPTSSEPPCPEEELLAS